MNFNTEKEQKVSTFGGDKTVVYMGRCALCGLRVYSDGDNDPRGVLGLRAYDPVEKASLDTHPGVKEAGDLPAIVACWGCKSNDGDKWRKLAAIVLQRWGIAPLKKWRVSYEVRQLGAIGVWSTKIDTVEGESAEAATEAFRAKHSAEFEFRFPIKVETT